MALLKIYGGQALQVALNEIISPWKVTYQALEAPEPDTIAALEDLRALTPHLSFTVAPAPPEAAADRETVQGSSPQELVFLARLSGPSWLPWFQPSSSPGAAPPASPAKPGPASLH